jgi:hypothetical protein
MRYDPGGLGQRRFGGAVDSQAFYHKAAAKKNVKLPDDGAVNSIRVRATPSTVVMAFWPDWPTCKEDRASLYFGKGLESVGKRFDSLSA